MYPQTIQLPYSLSAALNYFSTLAHKPWAMLLCSGGNTNNSYNRFDIIVADPLITLETKDNITIITRNNEKINYFLDPFELIKSEIKNLNINFLTNSDLPFQGGALGMWGYDLSRCIEIFPKIAKKELSCPDMAIGIYLWALIVDHQKKK